MPQAITSLISIIRFWLVTYWPRLKNGATKPNGNAETAVAISDECAAAFPFDTDTPPHPGWLRSESGEWVDPNCKFIHLEDLLDQIPICQKLLKTLGKHDADAYEYHRRLGARLVPDTGGIHWGRLNETSRSLLPTSGLLYMHERLSSSEEEDRVPCMIYFNKQAVNIWSNHGTAYTVVLAHWLRFQRDGITERKTPFAAGGRYTVIVDTNGNVLAVPEPTTITQKIHHHDALIRQGGGHVTTLHQQTVAIPRFLRALYDDRPRHEDTLEEWAGGLAAIAINAVTAGVNAKQFMVIAKRRGVSVRFDVGLENPKSFFKDRACALAVDGKRKRIIHWVNSFDRQLSDGRKVQVRGHFRGLTTFTWHGSQINVLMPKNVFDPRSFNVPIYELDEDDPVLPDMLMAADLAETLKDKMLEYGDKAHARG